MNTTIIIAHPSLGVVDQPSQQTSTHVPQTPIPGGVLGSAGAIVWGSFYRSHDRSGQRPIPGGVFGSAGAEVTGTYYRSYDPVKRADAR